jgi:cytochrome c5
MKRLILSSFVLLFFASIACVSATVQPALTEEHARTTSSQTHAVVPTGEQVFKSQCSRCHTPPMSISPRITGTVIMHMRVRARLSRQDEQLLLKYMAP